MIKGIYAGSFDPLTFGHLDIIQRSLKFCDELVIAVGINASKKTLFTVDERLQMIDQAAQTLDYTKISVVSFDSLLVELAKQIGATILVRGIRSVSDFEYEINLANINRKIGPGIDTVFLPTSPELSIVSSSATKEIARFGGNIDSFVPSFISKLAHQKFGFVKRGG
jgi:pantetheine-phosphate adenylyltransferase